MDWLLGGLFGLQSTPLELVWLFVRKVSRSCQLFFVVVWPVLPSKT